ncbi:MAG: molybdopterin converting factor subunit 1 [Pseudomonadota bacterium]
MKILYFAWLREKVGCAEEDLALPAHVRSVEGLLDWLKGRSPGHAEALADRKLVRIAVNHDYVAGDHALKPEDEVALFPPVTGGRS